MSNTRQCVRYFCKNFVEILFLFVFFGIFVKIAVFVFFGIFVKIAVFVKIVIMVVD